ncbi:MAG: class D sortase [Andreesenia angusta]|nr:class D sortase [Andreesenia angusta]
MGRKISNIFLFAGIILMLLSLGFKSYTKKLENDKIENFEKSIEEYKEEPEENKRLVNLNEEGEEIAIIEVPSIDLKSVITQGTSNQNLRYYLGHFMNTRMPGEPGNFCIAGHNSNLYNEILNNIHLVKESDLIKITTKDEEYNYYVKEKRIVEPNDVSVLEDDGDRKLMTIVTCTDKGNKRLVVIAEMES